MTRRALELAAKGKGLVSPGPLVGCVIVDGSGEIVGEGTYFYENMTHAEVVALGEAGDRAAGGTAYISLEPHSHHGRTPPCTEALIRAGISRVVAPIEDPNPLVSGKGFAVLLDHGIEVCIGLLREEAELQNEKFIHWHNRSRPFVHFKSAVSLDGKIATRTGDSKWITSESSRNSGQQIRAESDAILVGIGTVLADDPSLTDRSGLKRHKPLLRVILDTNLKLSAQSQVARSANEVPTIVFCGPNPQSDHLAALRETGIEVVEIDGGPRNLRAVLDELYRREIQSILLEGGGTVAGSFVEQRLVDKATYFLAPLIIGGEGSVSSVGGIGPEKIKEALELDRVTVTSSGRDVRITGYPRVASRVGRTA